MDPREQALQRIRILLEDSEPWARNYIRQPPHRLVDLDRMASSIVDAPEVLRGVCGLSPSSGDGTNPRSPPGSPG